MFMASSATADPSEASETRTAMKAVERILAGDVELLRIVVVEGRRMKEGSSLDRLPGITQDRVSHV